MASLSRDKYLVITADQKGSRRQRDRVPDALDALAQVDCVLPPSRTVGDEIQLISTDPAAWGQTLEILTRLGGWRLGGGIGAVELPLPDEVPAARGPAFLSARAAIESAHADPAGLDLDDGVSAAGYAGRAAAPQGGALHQAYVFSCLLEHLWSRRSAQGWEVIDVIRQVDSGKAAAAHLGISASAVSQRLRTAGWHASNQGLTQLQHHLADLMAGTE